MINHTLNISIPQEEIATFCARHHIRKLSLFGSVLCEDFRPDSDIDILAEYEPGAKVSLLDMGTAQVELSELFGREVDFKTAGFLDKRFRQEVIEEAQKIFEKEGWSMNERDKMRLSHMLEMARIAVSITRNETRESLTTNITLSLALTRAVEVIGEAAANISEETRQQYADVPWKGIVGMRHIIVHRYFDIDLDRLWQAVKGDIPELIAQLEQIV